MSNLFKELKNNKYTTIAFCIFLGIFLIAWLLYGMVMPSNGKPNYGNRLDDIEGIEVDRTQESDIIANLEKEQIVSKASTDVKGKIINVIVTVNENTNIKNAKELSKSITGNLTKEQLKHYDIQFFIKNEKEDAKGYPIIGYMSAGAKKFAY